MPHLDPQRGTGRLSRAFFIANTSLRLTPLGLKVYDWMAGKSLTFAGIGEKSVNAVPASSGQLVFDAPDFPQDKIAFGFRNCVALQSFHKSLMNSSGVANDGSV